MLYEENDPAGLTRANAFRQQLEKLGWAGGRNVRIDFIWGIGDASWIRSRAEAILLQTSPDIIVANGGASVRPVQSVTQDVPIIFIGGSDPVADGLVKSLSHPGGNVTGFTSL